MVFLLLLVIRSVEGAFDMGLGGAQKEMRENAKAKAAAMEELGNTVDPGLNEERHWLNRCSACQAVAYQAAAHLIDLEQKHLSGNFRYDAQETLSMLCTEKDSSVWKQYGLFDQHPIGLIAGPGIEGREKPVEIDDGKSSGEEQEARAKGVEKSLREACASNVLGGELDEDEIFELVKQTTAGKVAKGKSGKTKGTVLTDEVRVVAALLRAQFCDLKGTPCKLYRDQYGDPGAELPALKKNTEVKQTINKPEL